MSFIQSLNIYFFPYINSHMTIKYVYSDNQKLLTLQFNNTVMVCLKQSLYNFIEAFQYFEVCKNKNLSQSKKVLLIFFKITAI